jgi:hypothetical protein
MNTQDNNPPNFDKTKSYNDEEMRSIFSSNGESKIGKIDSLFINKNKYKHRERKINKENNENIENKETTRYTVVNIKDEIID